jgi:hypothetical protein
MAPAADLRRRSERGTALAWPGATTPPASPTRRQNCWREAPESRMNVWSCRRGNGIQRPTSRTRRELRRPLLVTRCDRSPTRRLFPRTLEIDGRADSAGRSRHGRSRNDILITCDLGIFCTWVNRYCVAAGRVDIIPPDPNGKLHPARLRRTLAWFIARKPRLGGPHQRRPSARRQRTRPGKPSGSVECGSVT